MLIFSTKLIVNEGLTKDVFIGLIIDWLSENRNYRFGHITYDGTKAFVIEKGGDSLEITDYEEALTVRVINDCGGVIWTNDYVLTQADNRGILAIQLYSDTESMAVKMPGKFNKPRILRQVVEKGYGGTDQKLPVSNEAFIITEENLEIARKLIMREDVYFMPVIYVSYPRYAIDEPIDFEAMARNLSGIAHVIVEPKEIAATVRRLTDERNPYDGAVEIFYGQQSSYRALPDNYESLEQMRLFIENSVQQKILMTRIDDAFSWLKIHFAHLQMKNQEDPEMIALYKTLLKEAEDEGDLKKEHIDELEYHIMELEERIKDLNAQLAQKKSQIQTYQFRFEQSGKEEISSGVNFVTAEKELYDGEIRDVIIKILEKEKGFMDSDYNLSASRKFHVLEDILKRNTQTGKADEIAECLSNIVDKSCSLNAQRKRQLTELGFEIKVGTHYKVTFNGDERYTFTLSKTASDYRTNTNTIKDAIATLFKR